MEAKQFALENGGNSSPLSKTTTVSTIAVQSGKTRLVIALLHCGDWLQLKILEVTPELTALGDTLNEALELQRAHDEVLRQLQNKQSPVEELLRQADQLIATQKPRAEVYAAMAESLAKAWKDVNSHLELRKLILDLNVQYHTRAQEFFDRMDALESACSDTIVPIEIDAVKSFLSNIHDLRRSVLEALMGALQAGNTIIDKLKELGAEGTLDSRPDRIRISVNRAITQVQGWMDKLHMRRQVLESTFSKRKNQLEQCLALALLAADLKELEENILRRCELFNSNDQLGDSSSSAELLQHENKKLLQDAKNLQEKAVKITKATDQLVQSGCFAGEQATQQSYFVLSLVTDYLNDLQQRDSLYDRVIEFFKASQVALSKLDDIDIQLRTNSLPITSPQLSQLHAQCSKDINDIVEAPLTEGYAILQSTMRNLNTSGVQKVVEDLENKKITLEALCVAHKEENIRINKALAAFLEKQGLLCDWLLQIEDNFLRDSSAMGDNLPAAKDFLEIHNRLLGDLQTKGNEINTLLLTLPPILEYLNDNQRGDVDTKVESLHERWIRLKNILESRLDLSLLYIKFHTEAEKVGKEMDDMESAIRDNPDISEEAIKILEERMENIKPLYQSAKNTGLTFINEARKVKEPHLDTNRACVCVESVLESLAGRQLTVERNWQTFHTDITEKRETEIKTEITMTESVKTINWVTKLDTQLYPVITTSSTNPNDISSHIENKLKLVLPEIQRAENEVEERIQAVNDLINTCPEKEDIKELKNKLGLMLEKLKNVSRDYKNLLQTMINYFHNLMELDNAVDEFNNEFDKAPIPNNIAELENLMKDHEESKLEIFKLFRLTQYDCEEIVTKILQQIPPGPAKQDIDKLKHLLELRKDAFEIDWNKRHDKYNAHHQLCQFDSDLQQINTTLEDLSKQLQEVKGQYSESLSASVSNSDSFVYFENTIDLLEQQIQAFITTGEKLLKDQHIHSPHISHHIQDLQDRWDKFKEQVKETRKLINLSINYFELIEDANNWFREGSNLLVSIAKRSTEVKQPKEAVVLLNEIELFLKPGEIKQNKRIKEISEIEVQLYGPEKIQEVINDNDDLIHSFNAISQELNSLAENLKHAQEQRELAIKEEEIARLKAEEEARRLAEEEARRKVEEETRRRQEEEEAKRRAAEEAARRKAEEEARRKAEEEAKRLEEEKAKRLAEEEAKWLADEEAKRKAEEEAKRIAEETIRLAEEEAKRLAEEEAKRKAEEAKRLVEEEAKRKAEEAKRLAEEEVIRLAAEKLKAEEETIRLAAERLKAEEQAKLKAEEEARRLAEERLAVEEAKRIAEEEAIRVAEEEAKRLAQEEAKRLAEEEFKRKAEEAERLKLKAEEERLKSEIKSKEALLQAMKAEEELIRREATLVHEPKTIIHKFEIESRESPDLGVQIMEVLDDGTPKLEPPLFVAPLSDQIIEEGSKFTFICHVTGTPLPIVTWHKDGISIQNNPDYQTSFDQGLCSLSIDETLTEDSARYTCSAINAAGSAETSATLTVKEIEAEEQLIPPTFIRELEPGLAKEGESFEFNCKVDGNPLPTVQWYKNIECIDNLPDYTITYNNGEAILRFETINLDDKGDYTCKAFNDVGIAQSTANLSVSPCEPTEPPAFITPLSNVMARAGQKIKLECEVSGLPPPNLQWSHNGKPVKETRELKLHRDGQKATLIILEAFPKDAGNYSVTAINPIGEITSTSSVSVKGRVPAETSDSEIASDMEPIKPSIQVHLKDVSINEGNRVRLDCVIVGQPEPEVIWYHDDRPVKESQDFQLLFQGDRCSLVIQEALLEDSGEYKVVALNSAGEASSKAMLSVTPVKESDVTKHPEAVLEISGGAPKFIKLLSDILVTEGDKVTLEALVSGEPKPEIKWLLNNTPLEPNENIKISHDDEGNVRLEMENVKPENRGVYTVKASNHCGDAKCFAQVIVKTLRSEPTKVLEEIKIAPSFKLSFNDRSVFENTPTKFECIVTGKPTPKCRWLFNDHPVSGKNFLISTVGDRQILSIPDVTRQENGKITCLAENDAGTASCSAIISVQSVSDITLPEFEKSVTDIAVIPTDLTQSLQGTTESTFSFKREINVQSSSSTSSKLITSTNGHQEPYVEEHKYSSQDQKSFKQINLDAPEIKESHKQEEYHKVGDHPPVVHEKSSSLYTIGGKEVEVPQIMPAKETPLPKSIFKSRPPKFMTPVIGKIVDQNVDIILEGILDGQPTPEISWTKNGTTLKPDDKTTITYEHNCAKIEIKNVSINDSGKYTCTAVNEAGKAISTADLVVRKTVFPPVFGRRLQAQIIKKGDRINMEVEVTGTPEPTVAWFKDGVPLNEVLKDGYKIKTQGNCYTLVLEKADLSHTGKYMVKANNSGGEAQSIADVAVYEPTPDTMVEVVKTVVFEDVQKHESLISAGDQKVEITTTAIEAAPIKITPFLVPQPFKPETNESISTEIVTHTENAVKHDTKTITLERTTPVPEIEMPKKYQPISEILPSDTIEEGIQTSSITKQQSLDYFVHKMKEVQEPKPKDLKDEIKPSPIKQEIFTKFENVAQETKQELLPKQQYEPYKPFETDLKKTPTFEPAPKIEPLKIEELPKLEPFPTMQSYSSFSSNQAQIYDEFKLTPEPPAEICYIPKQESIKTKEDLSQKVRRLEEAHRDLRDHEIPSGGVKIFPSPMIKQEFKEEKMYSKISKETKESSLRVESSSMRSSSPKPSLEGIKMEKLWTPKLQEPEKLYSETQYYKAETLGPVEKTTPVSHEIKSEKSFQQSHSMQQYYSHAPASITPEPSADAIAMEKSWAHKHVESVQKAWPPTKSEVPIVDQSWSTQSTLEKSWKPVEIIKETTTQKTDSYIPPPLPVPHYVAEVSHSSKIKEIIQSSHMEQKHMSSESYISEDRNVKPSEIIKSWPPKQESSKPIAPPYIETVRPVSVQDITNEIYLEPGTPPEIAYAQPPPRKVSYVEAIEQDLEKKLIATKVPPCAVRTIPPPAEMVQPEPFKPSPQQPKHVKVGPPPTPSKFFKGKITDSDYESDFESMKIPSKWKPYASDTDEPKYRHVNPPRTSPMPRSRSIDKEPLPPSKFEKPAQLSGFARPSINFEACKQIKKETYKKQTSSHFIKSHEVKATPPAPVIKPGSPPIYIKADSPKVKPQSPKTKHKIVQDGYMADTDEPFGVQQKKVTKSEYKHEEFKQFSSYQSTQSSQSYQQKISPVVTPKFTQQKKHVASSSSTKKKLVSTPIVSTVSTSERLEEKKEILEPFPFKPDPPSTRVKLPPPPSPSKFVKGEFKESDYESDYEGRIPPLWGGDRDKHYRPVRVVLTPSGRHSHSKDRSPTPPTEFDDPNRVPMPTRPKFEPIEKPQKSVKLDQIIKPVPKPTPIFRPKPIMQQAPITDIIIATPAVIKPGSPPRMSYAPGPKRTQYYSSTTSTPYHNAVQTETSNVVHFNESTENARRTMSVQQTTKVIKFGDKNGGMQNLEPFPYKVTQERPRQSSVPPPPKPSKFVPGEFRESDYESEVESVRIKPKWSPRNEGGDLRYRKVRAPAMSRSSSVPVRGERVVTPMEFDTQPPYQPQISKESKSSQLINKSYENNLKADYNYAPVKVTKSTATKIASHHMDNMTKSFKSKAQQFVNDIMDDVNNKSSTQKPILKSKDETDAQVYREETRASQFGTKHVDPDTGLIYFKYDFGYEFGVILPGESKNGEIPVPKKTIIQPPQRSESIEMPVYHERTKTNAQPTQFQPKKFSTNKNVKWEPTSESEMSESEADGKKRWEQSSCSPLSVSPSIPSVSPAFHTSSGPTLKGIETPPSCPSTPGVQQNAGNKRAPIFITPLRDIAVVSGQTARFECIVQSEPPPNILWSKNGRIIENSYDYQLFLRNGVCRLTIPKAYPEDAGTYTCTATNSTGAVNTTATLQVPGERRSSYI